VAGTRRGATRPSRLGRIRHGNRDLAALVGPGDENRPPRPSPAWVREFTDPTKSFCLIDEITFSGGGQMVTFEQFVEWLGLPDLADADAREGASDAAGAAGS
jgi:hypothetical protein